jgi:hypothetical protein
MKLVPNWQKAFRMVSVQCMTAAAALQMAWGVLDTELKASLSPTTVSTITIVLLVLGVLGRLVRQPGVDSDHGSKTDRGGDQPDAS